MEDSAPPEARLQVRDDGRHMPIVGTGSKPLSMFDSKYWTMVEPRLFPYGDGVFGVLRDVELSFDEWVTYLLNREELDYVGVCGKRHDVNDADQVCESLRVDQAEGTEGVTTEAFDGRVGLANSATVAAEASGEGVAKVAEGAADVSAQASRNQASRTLPRWRGARDFKTQCYCHGRRRAYIRSARLFSSKKHLQQAIRELGALRPEEMYQTCDLLGKGEGLKDAMANPSVPARVKAAMRSLMLCMSNVLGTNTHRTTLRHVCTSYRNVTCLDLRCCS